MTISRITAAGCLAVLLAAGTAHGQALYSNGPFVTHEGAHVSGADVSLAQDVTYPGYTALGYAAGPGWRLADDFTVPVGKIWTITGARLFAFQPNVTAGFTDARVIIWLGVPDGPVSTKVFDGTVSNTLVDSTPGPYRIAQSTEATAPFTNVARRVHVLGIAIPELVLESGNYWVDWQLTGGQSGQVYTPPVSIIGQPYTALNGFARQKCPPDITSSDCPPSQWRLFINGSAPYNVDLPFELDGTSFDDSIFVGDFEEQEDEDP
ncbi:MAG: hypothetical protein J0L88_11460 [Xanthomonadales bacterium]|nr:hypothetical protein [Xanthomonadales bacterium]